MADPNYSDQEHSDANDAIPRAIRAIAGGKLEEAESILLAVIANTPPDYRYEYEGSDRALHIKFWDQEDFIFHITRLKELGKADRNIYWMSNAYGRAYYYLGFLCMKQKLPIKALQYLDAGLAIEPPHPLMQMEHARAISMSGDRLAALREFDAVIARGDEIRPKFLGAAIRGRGFELIELARLDEAEATFRQSLALEPNNPIAINELQYIHRLRSGGGTVPLARTMLGNLPEQPKRWWEFWR